MTEPIDPAAAETQFRAFVAACPLGIHMYRLEAGGALVFAGANPAADRILGIDHAPFKGRPIEACFPQLAGTEVPARYRDACLHGTPWHTERIEYRDGRVAGAFEVTAFQTVPGSMAALFSDIRSRAVAEQALADAEERYRLVVEEAFDALLIHDRGIVLDVNRKLTRELRYARDRLIGRSAMDLIHPDDRPLVARMSASDRVEKYEARVLAADGTVYDTSVVSMPIPFGGRTVRAVAIRDTTRQKATECELQRHRRNLEEMVAHRTRQLTEANRELEAFCYSLTHDLRAPIRNLRGFAQAMREECADCPRPAFSDYLGRLETSADRMMKLVDSLLRLFRHAQRPLSARNVDLSRLAATVLQAACAVTGGRRIQTDVQPGLHVLCDAELLQVVLENLFANAVKFTAQTAEARIRFGALQADGQTVYFVADNGAGFDMRYAANLFAPFQRLHREADFEGTGIGLATVRRIIHRHGGAVWADARPGEGATFYFTLQCEEAG